MYIISITG